MPSDASFVGNIPQFYDQGLGRSSLPTMPPTWRGALPLSARHACWKPRPAPGSSRASCAISSRPERADGHRSQPADARSRAHEIPLRRKGRVQPADATALPFADGSFDLVVCQFGVHVVSGQGKIVPRGLSRRWLVAAMIRSVSGVDRYNPVCRDPNEIVGGFFDRSAALLQGPFSCHQIIDQGDEIGPGLPGFSAAGDRDRVKEDPTWPRSTRRSRHPLHGRSRAWLCRAEQVIEDW